MPHGFLFPKSSNDDNGKTEFQKLNLVRVPLRLGFDVFEKRTISPEKEEMILKTIKAYKYLIDVYEVKHLQGLRHFGHARCRNSAADY